MLWNGKGMEWKENFGMKCGRCSEWNGMEDLKNRMEDRMKYGRCSEWNGAFEK